MKIINSVLMGMLTLILLPLTTQAYEQLPIVEDGYDAQIYCECLYYMDSNDGAEEINRPKCDDVGPVYPIMSESELAETNGSVDPIYIGGVLYQLNKSDFTPVYNERWIFPLCNEEPVLIRTLAGYTINIPVNGDAGQELIFDINGRSNGKVMNLTASCGSFSASDSGDKYIISKRMTTNATCTNMVLKFSFTSSIAPTLIDMSVLIAEPF